MKTVGFQGAQTLSIWAVSDGRAGIENQALGLAEAIARRTPAAVHVRRVQLRPPWGVLPAWATPFPRQALTDDSDAIEPPWPDLFIGCGRHSLPFALGVKSWSRGHTYTVQLQDPRMNPREFDLVVAPSHDELEGENVLSMVGSCHRVTPERIAAGAAAFGVDLSHLSPPCVGVLIGGKSKRQDISEANAMRIVDHLMQVRQDSGASLLVTLSRRTGAKARAVFEARLKSQSALFYDGDGPNPYFAILNAADALLVTADSVNMTAEAASTGKPVMSIPVDGDMGKLLGFHAALADHNRVRVFTGRLENWRYEPLMETDRIAQEVVVRFANR
jgi:mitochondrial fission protein ELM1